MTGTIVGRLAEFVAGTHAGDVPEPIRRKAGLHILDTLGAGLAGAGSREAIGAGAALVAADGAGSAAIWGRPDGVSPRNAAFVNGIACHAYELDDTGGCDHSGAVVVPALVAALPLAQAPVDGRAFVTATVLGYDVGRRVMEGFGGYVPHNGAGWHSTGTCGVFASAAAVASLLRLDATLTAHALGLAASFSSGLWGFIHDGAMAKRVHAGRAAEGGLLAALLARQGVTGPAHAFEDVWGGFFNAYAHGPVDRAALTRDLGRDWLMRHAAIKPYASCRDTHAAIDAVDRVLQRKNFDGGAVVGVRVRLNAFLAGMVGGREVDTLPAAQMSLPYAVAARLVFGTAGLAAYSEERRASSMIAELLPSIAIEIDPTVSASWRSSVIVQMRDGTRIEEATSPPLGAPENPMSPERLRSKYDELARLSVEPDRADAIATCVLGLDDGRDAGMLPILLRGAPR